MPWAGAVVLLLVAALIGHRVLSGLTLVEKGAAGAVAYSGWKKVLREMEREPWLAVLLGLGLVLLAWPLLRRAAGGR